MNYDILEMVKNMRDFTDNLETRKQELYRQLSVVDKELNDLYHAAEYLNLSASQGYKLYKMLHDTRNRRREYKKELQKIDLILGNDITNDNLKKLEQKIRNVDAKTQKYEPKVITELFDSKDC